MKQIICPYCGYKMPIWYVSKKDISGIFVKCKGRNCKKQFEIKIENNNQVVPLCADDLDK